MAHDDQLEEQLLRQTELQETERRYRFLVETSQDLIWSVDAEGRFTFLNQAARLFYGREPEEMIGRNFLDFAPPGQYEKDLAALGETLQTGREILEYTGRVLRADGSIITLRANSRIFRDSEGRIAGVSGTSRDVTEHERAEKALRESVERFELVGRATNDAVWDWDLNENTLWWSENFNTLFGYSPHEVEPGLESWTKHIHSADLERVRKSFRAAIESGEAYWEGEYRYLRRDGTYAEIFDRGYIIRDESGKAVRMIGAMMDITQRKLAEDRARQSEEQLRHSQKMDAVGQLSGGVAHDFNNILTIIRGNASLIPCSGPEEAAEYVEEIMRATERGASLTRQLLTFSRKHVLQLTNLDVSEIASDMTKMLQRILGEDITLRSEHPSMLPLVHADEGMIEQVLLNLAVNARDAMPGGGRLTITTRAVTIDELAASQMPEATPGLRICLSVSDTGPGFRRTCCRASSSRSTPRRPLEKEPDSDWPRCMES